MAEIVPTNISAVGVVYTAAQLEEAKLFAVADGIGKMFHAGTLPTISNAGGAVLLDYIKQASIRLKTLEGRRSYARAFRWARSDTTDVRPNRDFDALWMRFIGEVSEFVEERNRSRESAYARGGLEGCTSPAARTAGTPSSGSARKRTATSDREEKA